MMRARVARLESSFGANCDWFVMDTKVEFEEVSYPDPETGETVVKQYHSPWVPDDEYEDYEPTRACTRALPEFIPQSPL